MIRSCFVIFYSKTKHKKFFTSTESLQNKSITKISSCTNIKKQPLIFRIGSLKNLAIFTGKHLCWSLFFNKLAGFLLFLKNSFFIEHLRWLLFLKLILAYSLLERAYSKYLELLIEALIRNIFKFSDFVKNYLLFQDIILTPRLSRLSSLNFIFFI